MNAHHSLNYLSGGAMLVNLNGVETLYYGYTDNQGSLVALTDANGNVVEKYAYDPWGARRNPANWTQKDSRTAWITNRGYTGHEHLDAFGIINMNGSAYDPATGQFMSPDPFIQSPGDWVNYNRYSYCMGNPMRYTDPSGYVTDPVGADGMTNQQWMDYWTIRRMEEQSAGYAYAMGRFIEQMNHDRQEMADAANRYLPNGLNPSDVAVHYGDVGTLGYDHLYALELGGQLRLAGSIGGEITGTKDGDFVTTNNVSATVLAALGSPVCTIPQSDPNSHTDALGYYHNYTENETKAATDFMLGVGLSLLGGEAVGPYIGKVGSFISNGGIKAVVQAVQYQAYKAIGYLGAGTVGAVGANLVGGGLEGYLKYKTYTPIDTEIPYLFDNPAWHVGSDLINNILTIENDK